MLYHGASKLRGDGPTQTAQMFEQLGIRPARTWAIATGLAEALAGVAAVLGVATRPAAVAVIVTQAVAIARVHAAKGYSVTQGGFEYNLALIAIAAGLLVGGPGRVSAHEALEHAVEGRGGRRPWQRARRGRASRAIRLLK
jgi:putative oxidoreductase